MTTFVSSLQSADSASIATEYSVKFEDSMTEDDIEEKSFRSLLPSEAHRRESLDRKPSPRPESDDDHSHDRTSPRESSKVSLFLIDSVSSHITFITYPHLKKKVMAKVKVKTGSDQFILRSSQHQCKQALLFSCYGYMTIFVCFQNTMHSRIAARLSPAVRTASPNLLWKWCDSTWKRRRFALSTRVHCFVCARKPSEIRPKLSWPGWNIRRGRTFILWCS